MDFQSVEQAIEVLVNSKEDSAVYEEALEYCIENAPPDLRESLYSLYRQHFYDVEPLSH
ncbi:MAG: hypothetical protein ACOY5C_11860 [Pseudomonadota bacterium]